MTEKSLTEMSDDEIIAEIQALRERRAQAKERRAVEKDASKVSGQKGPEKVSDALWDMLEGPTEAT